MTFVVSSTNSFPLSVNPTVNQGISAKAFISSVGAAAVQQAAQRYGPKLANAAQTRLDSTINGISDVISGNNSSGGIGQNKNFSKNSGNGNRNNNSNNNNNGNKSPGGRRPKRYPSDSSSLSKLGGSSNASGVPQFSLDTGIESGIIINPLQETTKHYTPLFIQCGQLFSDSSQDSDNDLSYLMSSRIYFYYIDLIQQATAPGLSRDFTVKTFYAYIDTLIEALQLYYMIDSILAYTSNFDNSNMAMTKLRMAIDPTIYNGHIQLKEFLSIIPIPPNLLEYIRCMYQNYSFNNVEGSSIIRLSLNDSLCTSEYDGGLGIDGGTYTEILDSLFSKTKVISCIKKIREEWIRPLPPSSFEALYDAQFSTFWHNSNISYEDYGSKAVKYTIRVKSNQDQIYYGIFDNKLDGLIYASCSVMDENDVMQKGLWYPFSDFGDRDSINSSLLHYANDRFIRPVTDVSFRNASMVHAAPFTRITSDGNPIWEVTHSNFAGSSIPQVHTLDTVVQALSRSVDWLLRP